MDIVAEVPDWASRQQLWRVQCALMMALTFGYNLTPRPGQLLSLMHPDAPVKCDQQNCSASCPGNVVGWNALGLMYIRYAHHKNEARTGQPIPAVTFPSNDPLVILMTWWINVGWALWRGGGICDDEGSVSQHHLFINKDGQPFSPAQWRAVYGDCTEQVAGVRQVPMKAR